MADIEERAYTDEKIDYANYLSRKKNERKRTREETIDFFKKMARGYEKCEEEAKAVEFEME